MCLGFIEEQQETGDSIKPKAEQGTISNDLRQFLSAKNAGLFCFVLFLVSCFLVFALHLHLAMLSTLSADP